MLQLISHIVRTSSRRDRTEINAALIDAMADLFNPVSVTIYRCYPSSRGTVLFACAGIASGERYVHNAYLPDRRYCRPIDEEPLLARCRRERSVALESLPGGADRLAFPVIQLNQLVYVIEIVVSEDFPADLRVLLLGVAEYFGNHIGLLDYGETDTLTQLSNRKTFDKHLFELLGRAQDDSASAAPASRQSRRKAAGSSAHWLAVCDIDRFKSINDNHGHLMGDEVLVILSQIMRRSFRFDDQLFRFGGEEFVVVLQPTRAEDALKALERFRRNVESHNFTQVGKVTVSVGFSRLKATDTPTDVIDRADEALYYCKENGRNRVACYEHLVDSGALEVKDVQSGDIELF